MELPNAQRALVPAEKTERYLLDLDHPKGGAKARFFMMYGFTADRPERLNHALLSVARSGSVVETVPAVHGTKYVVDGEIETPRGWTVRLRTVWIILPGEDVPRFVTSYPAPGGP